MGDDVADPRSAPGDVLHRFYAAVDDKRYADLLGYLTDDARSVGPAGETTGAIEHVRNFRLSQGHLPAIQHLITGVVLDEADDGVQFRANLVAFFTGPDGGPVFEVGHVWRGTLVPRAGEWRLSVFSVSPVWQRGTRPTT